MLSHPLTPITEQTDHSCLPCCQPPLLSSTHQTPPFHKRLLHRGGWKQEAAVCVCLCQAVYPIRNMIGVQEMEVRKLSAQKLGESMKGGKATSIICTEGRNEGGGRLLYPRKR